MEYIINERIIKVTGKANIPFELETGHEYELLVKVDCESELKSNNHDGTYNLTYKLPLLGEVELKSDKGEKIIAKVKESQSKKFRDITFALGYEYEIIMNKAIANAEQVLEFISKLN